MEKVLERAKNIILGPAEALSAVKTEAATVSGLMKEYVIYVAAIPAIANLLGWTVFGHFPFFRSLIFAACSYVLSLVAVVIVGKVIDFLAPSFNSTKNDLNAFKLAVYSMTPGFVAGIFGLIPPLAMLSFLGSLYGIYILYIGLPVLMGTPDDKRAVYTVAIIIAVVIVMFIISAIAGAIAWSGGMRPSLYM